MITYFKDDEGNKWYQFKAKDIDMSSPWFVLAFNTVSFTAIIYSSLSLFSYKSII